MKTLQEYVTNEYDSDEEKEIIAYGLERIRENVLAFGFTVLVGFCYGDVLSGVLLWVFLYPIRSSAGGYHAQTRWGYRVMSVSLLLAAYTAVYAVNRLAYGQMILLGLLLCAVLTLWLLAPIGTENKPLDDIEHRIYQKRTRIIVLVETILAVFTLYEGISVIYLPIVMAFLISSALLVMGCIKLRKNKGK